MIDFETARRLVKMLKEYMEGAQTWVGPRRERIDKILKKLEEVLENEN